jgi:hypothetical protein
VEELNMFLTEIANRTYYMSEKEKKEREEERYQKERELREEEEKQAKKKARKQDGKDKAADKEEVKREDIVLPPEEIKIDVTSDFKVEPTMVVDFLNYWMTSKEERKRYL